MRQPIKILALTQPGQHGIIAVNGGIYESFTAQLRHRTRVTNPRRTIASLQ